MLVIRSRLSLLFALLLALPLQAQTEGSCALQSDPDAATGGNALSTVRVSVSTPAHSAVASVYDALGRRVGVLHEGPLSAGAHDFTLAASSLAPSVYVVQVRVSPEGGAATWTAVQRITVTR